MNYTCENESDEEPTSEVLQLRTFRRLVVEEAVSPALNNMLKTKRNRFTNNYHPSNAVYPGTFRTFLMTAGGANDRDADKLMKSLVKALNESTRIKLEWWRKLRGSLSIGLLRYATRMALAGSIRSMN